MMQMPSGECAEKVASTGSRLMLWDGRPTETGQCLSGLFIKLTGKGEGWKGLRPTEGSFLPHVANL